MNSQTIRSHIENKGRIIVNDFTYNMDFNNRTLPTITAMRLGRFLATSYGRNIVEESGYNSESVIIIADDHRDIQSINDSISKYSSPGFIAFTENDKLVIGVIE